MLRFRSLEAIQLDSSGAKKYTLILNKSEETALDLTEK